MGVLLGDARNPGGQRLTNDLINRGGKIVAARHSCQAQEAFEMLQRETAMGVVFEWAASPA